MVRVSGNKNDVPNSCYVYAKTLAESIKNSYFLDESVSGANPLAHYETTAAEIFSALENKVDLIVVPIRTGAAFTGIAKYVEQHQLKTKVYGVCSNDSLSPCVPELRDILSVVDLSCGSGIEVVCSKEAFLMTRRLIREEGLMVGPSSGAAILAALKLGESLPEQSNVVVIGADGIRNYMNHFIDDEWLYKNRILNYLDKKTLVPKEQFDPKVLIYDPTTLSEEWKQDEISKKWTICSQKIKQFRTSRPAVMENVLEAINNTPLVKLQKLPAENGIKCNMYVKCEYFNAGGSTKDRIALRMIELAEAEGRLKPGMTLIEPTSGNTGIGLSLAAAVKGYDCIIVMPMKMSREKALTMEALGSFIVRTPNEAAFDSAYSHIGVALRLRNEIPGAIILDQYRNIGNPLVHYEQTAEEIVDALDGNVDYVVVAAGTGGTVTGIAKKIKEKVPNCVVVGVDPEGSVLADPSENETGFYEVEGVGYDFVPGTLDRSVVDKWLKSTDKESFETARDMISKEGILCGGSSGSNVHAALEIAKELPADKNVVTILPDGIRNYLTKFIDNEWMAVRRFNINEEF